MDCVVGGGEGLGEGGGGGCEGVRGRDCVGHCVVVFGGRLFLDKVFHVVEKCGVTWGYMYCCLKQGEDGHTTSKAQSSRISKNNIHDRSHMKRHVALLVLAFCISLRQVELFP